MPTLRFERPRRETLRPWSGSGGSQRCDMSATVLRTTTQEPTHTPLLHSTCAYPPERRALARLAADLARWRSGGLAARPWGLRRKSSGGRQFHVPASAGRAQRLDAGRAHGASGWRAAGDVPATDGRLARIARATRCTGQRGRPVGRLARCGVLGRDALGHGGSDTPQLTDTGLGWWVARWKPLRADLAGPVRSWRPANHRSLQLPVPVSPPRS